MRLLIMVTFFCLGLSPVVAQEPVVAQQIDCSDTRTQAEMTFCAGVEFENADQELNALWPQIRAAMKERDAFTEDRFKISDELVLEAQRSWLKYRDAHCDGYALLAAGGTMQPMLGSLCRASLTRERITTLKSLLNTK